VDSRGARPGAGAGSIRLIGQCDPPVARFRRRRPGPLVTDHHVVTNRDPLPVEALRDLIGIARAMYAAARAEGATPYRLEQLAQAGTELRRALDLASKSEPDTMGHRAAWVWAQRGYERLLQQITVTTQLQPVMAAAASRVLAARKRESTG
jgi:hypothetical protein